MFEVTPVKRKIIVLLVAVLILLTLVDCSGILKKSQPAQQETEPASTFLPPETETIYTVTQVANGTCGDSITWTLNSEGTLIVSGTGAIPNYEKGSNKQPWVDHWKSIQTLVIEDGITRIGDRAFQGFRYLQSAHMGKDVASIGQWAFQNCYALTVIDFPPETQLETGAFRSTPAEWGIYSPPSTQYADSRFYTALSQVVLTGNYRDDVINVARSQIGYHEGNSEGDYHGGNASGSKDYTEYGRALDSVGSAWCSEFASWCIRMALVPNEIIASSRTANIVNFTKNASAVWYTWDVTSYCYGSYTPQKGDLLLWAWDTNTHTTEENLSHTSILVEVEQQNNGTVLLKTIEGNSKNQVRESTYKVNAKDGSLIGREGYLCFIVAPDYEGSNP